MSKTLHLVEGLLSRGRRLQELGRYSEAGVLFKKLIGFRLLPTKVAEEIQSRLADIQFQQGQFARARRHLRAALAHEPVNAEYHHRFAVALEEDPDCDPQRAVRHYARCVKLDPKNPLFLCDFAYAALNAGQSSRGLAALRKAQGLAPDDAEVLALVVRGLVTEKREDEARRLLRAALFRNPRDYRFRAIWQRFQFDLLSAQQQQRIETTTREETARTILPFPRRSRKSMVGAKTVRHDGPATLKGPYAAAPKRSARQ
jgi:tetratricopeptide (TPR) repeat protein